MKKPKPSDRGALLQFECDRTRVSKYSSKPGLESPNDRIYHLAHCAAWDTIQNGGTFVLVVTPEKITMVQRPEADDLDAPEQQQ